MASVSRASSWRLRDGEWFDNSVIDAYLMYLQAKEKNRPYEGQKRIWYLSCEYSLLGVQRPGQVLHPAFSGDWNEMGYIALPLNVVDCHWFMMVISFVDMEIYILDSYSGLGYTERNIVDKVKNMHTIFSQHSEYQQDITQWPVWYMNDDVPQQPNGCDCGPFMCFFMTHLRELVPNPRKDFFVNVDYLRIWIANEMTDTIYNSLNEDVLEGLKEFKEEEDNVREWAFRYRKIPSVTWLSPNTTRKRLAPKKKAKI